MVELDGSIVLVGDFILVVEELGFIWLLDRCVFELVVECFYDNLDVNLVLNVLGMIVMELVCFEGYIDYFEVNFGIVNWLIVEFIEILVIWDLEELVCFLMWFCNFGC